MTKADTTQQQFLTVIDRDLAEQRFRGAFELMPLGEEKIPLSNALGRVLARDILAPVDVPSFDRSNFDGFAIRAADSFGASEERPKTLRVIDELIATAVIPKCEVTLGTAVPIATGGMVPRGADSILMIEHADAFDESIHVRKSLSSGFGISFAGTDISLGETVLRKGETLTSRETGVIASIGLDHVFVWRKPKVAIISTGDELIAPGCEMQPGLVYDSNARILSDAVAEAGGIPIALGIVNDDLPKLRACFEKGMASADVVVLSGGTSKGAGDLSYRVVSELTDPGIVAHGVALKPGKPICLAVSQGKPIVILPGFPTSAVFTFHEFVAPVIRIMAGLSLSPRSVTRARLATKVNSEVGRTEYLLVGLIADESDEKVPYAAYPMGKGSGSVTTFSRADGFVTIDRHTEILNAGEIAVVQLLGQNLKTADLVVIGSHCTTLDMMLGKLQDQGFHTKFMAVGSSGGLAAAKRGECDVAGIHLLDVKTNEYNRPFLSDELTLVPGYERRQGIIVHKDDTRFAGKSATEIFQLIVSNDDLMMINRNQGSGTRILIDQFLKGQQPNGYAIQAKNHNAVAGAIVQKRADWGIGIERVALQYDLCFVQLRSEQFDFAVPKSRMDRPAVRAFLSLLSDPEILKLIDNK